MVSKKRINTHYMSEMQIPILEQTKECWKCKVILPLDCFAKRGKGLRRGGCRSCNKLTDSPLKKYYYRYPKTEEQKEKIRIYQKSEKFKNRVRRYTNFKFKTNPQFKLKKNLRHRLRDAIKNETKVGSAVKDLGCTIEELKIYFEKQFVEGMTWENHGNHGWHIDHIIPLSSFDLTDREQFLKACHYTNLQPLWAKDNLSKGSKVIHS